MKWLFMVFMKNPIQISKISGDITVIILWLSDNQKIEEVLKLVELHKSVGQNERVCQWKEDLHSCVIWKTQVRFTRKLKKKM